MLSSSSRPILRLQLTRDESTGPPGGPPPHAINLAEPNAHRAAQHLALKAFDIDLARTYLTQRGKHHQRRGELPIRDVGSLKGRDCRSRLFFPLAVDGDGMNDGVATFWARHQYGAV